MKLAQSTKCVLILESNIQGHKEHETHPVSRTPNTHTQTELREHKRMNTQLRVLCKLPHNFECCVNSFITKFLIQISGQPYMNIRWPYIYKTPMPPKPKNVKAQAT